jgi:deferrochelatase/peroxidase EfeB
MSRQQAPDAAKVELDDVQGLVRFAYKHHTEASFLLLRVKDPEAARAWLVQAPVTSAVRVDPPPPLVLQVALTSEGMRALGVPEPIIEGFSPEFIAGMSSDAARSRRLGDVGSSDPSLWQWGAGERSPHVAVMLYALPGRLAEWQRSVEAQCDAGFERVTCLPTSDMQGVEPFGFVDGISQPQLDWARQRPARDQDELACPELSCLGEFLLGYPNEYGLYTPRPLLDLQPDTDSMLPLAEDDPGRADLGRNGSYLIIRQLRQDVRAFWQTVERQAGGNPGVRERLAEAMVGRTLHGVPLVGLTSPVNAGDPGAPTADLNAFNYESDPRGIRCPLGAHIRRANPRNADLPPGPPGIASRLWRVLGFDAQARRQDLVASTRFHRLLRRGREYGAAVPIAQALEPSSGDADPGLNFLCLAANIMRQFEFVQSAWMMGTHFNGLAGEGDPLLGSRLPNAAGTRADGYSMPRPDGPDRRVSGLPRFVTVLGGAYFFLPGIRALRFLSGAYRGRSAMSLDTTANTRANTGAGAITLNPDRPVPHADTGSKLLNWLADASIRFTQLERRVDPFVRPAFDAVLRDPIARLTTALINWQRSDEGLKIAEERLLPDEDKWVDSIISSFQAQMRGLWKPGRFERGGNTKTQGIVRAEFIVHDSLPAQFRHGIFAQPRTWRAWVRFSGPGPYITPDIDDVGFMSISIKLMGVPGPKLMDEEKFTQDMFGVSTPTFVTPDVRANAQLQINSLKNAAIFHFINFKNPHLLDLIMQGLWVKTQSSPFEAPYFSCVPYLLGEGQAMQYSVWPTSKRRTPIPRLPLRPPDDYLRNAMIAALDAGDVELDFRIQLQTDPYLMPIENAAVLWPERLSPRVSVATLRIPRQTFASPAQLDFARRLSYNPWHCIAEHRPLGNQSRARRRMYWELSKLRHDMNGVPHYEPTGDETFD